MFEPALIQHCADPSLKPAIVEQFIQSAGNADPLAVTAKSAGRLILVPKAQNAEEALALVRDHVGWASVRVGVTQFPAGLDVAAASEIKADLVDPCENLRMGTRMFAKILRIVAKWYGNPTNEDVFPQIFDDAIYAWKTGEFEGVGVFQAEDPGGRVAAPRLEARKAVDAGVDDENKSDSVATDQADVGLADIRVDLSRIGGR